ncbi:MAG TPA: adenylyl-sulfate kinase [Polyangiaceae bacterium]|nr:adenylyl-sulfate kinase [Polyangiaceae bacterium]
MARGFVLWFTGLSGSGKSTLTSMVAAELRRRGVHVETLDGDEVRKQLSRGLGFSRQDRDENIRRIGFVAKLVGRSGACAIAAAISPYREVRNEVRHSIENFVEVYTECPISVLAERDPKGLYKKALAGEIKNFTGVDDPYEAPESPEVRLHTDRETPAESLEKILDRLEHLGLIPAWGKWRQGASSAADANALVAPHGQELVDRTLSGDAARAALDEARSLPVLDLDVGAHADVASLANGAYSPLRGFMTSKDYLRVVDEMRLESGLPWALPITLSIPEARASELRGRGRAALRAEGRIIATLQVEDVFRADPARASELELRASSEPDVESRRDAGLFCGGEIQVIDGAPPSMLASSATPRDVRDRMAQAGWSRAAAFETDAPPLGAEEYVARACLDFFDGVLVTPTMLASDRIPLDVRVRCFETLLAKYFPPRRSLLAPRVGQRRGGARRRAIHGAIVAKNYGASHYVVHQQADASPLDDPARWLDGYSPRELGVELWPIGPVVLSDVVGGTTTRRAAPDVDGAAVLRTHAAIESFRAGNAPDVQARPEVLAILSEYFVRAR